MAFAGVNYLAIVVAAVAGWLTGAVWYGLLFSKPWQAANNIVPDKSRGVTSLPFILAFVAQVVMAWMLAGILSHLGPGQVTIRNGVISAAFLWFGFIITTLAVNNTFVGRKPILLAIDGGHWLAVMLVLGAVIGAFGVK
jgi:Protein of unknown function (DUF1761)